MGCEYSRIGILLLLSNTVSCLPILTATPHTFIRPLFPSSPLPLFPYSHLPPSTSFVSTSQRLISTGVSQRVSLTGTVKFTGDESPLVLSGFGDTGALPTTPPALDIGGGGMATEAKAVKRAPGEGEGDFDI